MQFSFFVLRKFSQLGKIKRKLRRVQRVFLYVKNMGLSCHIMREKKSKVITFKCWTHGGCYKMKQDFQKVLLSCLTSNQTWLKCCGWSLMHLLQNWKKIKIVVVIRHNQLFYFLKITFIYQNCFLHVWQPWSYNFKKATMLNIGYLVPFY